MATIQSIISSINENKNEIASKLEAMGLTVAGDKKLSDIADTAGAITVDSETTEVLLGRGQDLKLEAGKYYKNTVTVAPNVYEKFYDGEDTLTESKSGSVGFQLNSSGVPTNITPITVSAPRNYIFTEVGTPSLINQGQTYLSGISATATISDDGKTLTITLTGKSNSYSGYTDKDLNVTVSYNYTLTNEITSMGTPVAPSTKEQHFYSDEGTVMTAFTVEAIPISNPTVSTDNIITTKDGAGDSYSVSAPKDGDKDQYMSSLQIPKVVIDSATVNYDELYNGGTGNLVVTASENSCNGLNQVTIPRPTVTSETQSVDILSAEANDKIVPIAAGYKSASNITIETAELYNALAAI